MSQGKKPWRPPDTEQDKLEKQTASLILAFLKSGKIDGKDFSVDQDKQDKLEQDLAQLLQQAHTLGTQYGSAMIKHQEAISLKKVTIGAGIAYFLKKAKDVVSGLVTRMSNTIADVFSKGGNASDAQDTIDNMMDYVPDQTSCTVIHDEVENGVLDTLKVNGVEQIEWICEPGACETCLDNEDQGPIDIGDTFSSGHDSPPAHVNCRCNVMIPLKDEDA